MPSTFPGMNPYIEHPAFWSSFHTRLLVANLLRRRFANADTLAPQLLPNYYIDVETRIYQEQDEDEVLVGIPDATVLSANLSHPASIELQPDTGSTLTQKRPQSITLPMPVTVKERYLEVREIGTDAVITVIEVLSPKNKHSWQG